MNPRCGKLLRTGNLCNRRAGHTGRCYKQDLERKAATAAAWGAANPERKAATTAAWQKANPERVAANNAAWVKANPERMAAYATITAAWVAANPERVAATNAVWRAANPERLKANNQKRRAAIAGATTVPFTPVEYEARMAEFGNVCYYCALLGVVGPHECDDHVFPIKPRKGHKPGPHALRNLVPSCNAHNSQKHNKQPINFINKLLETQC